MSFKVLVTIDQSADPEQDGAVRLHTNVRSFWEQPGVDPQETRDPGRVLAALEHARVAVLSGQRFEPPRLVSPGPLVGRLSKH